MIHRFIYQQKPVYTQADTALFSKGGFTCIRLYLTKKAKPMALSEGPIRLLLCGFQNL